MDPEKPYRNAEDSSLKSSDSPQDVNFHAEHLDPEDSLHRGLKARQVSMIAVGFMSAR